MKKTKSFTLKNILQSTFYLIKQYLMTKYAVYSAKWNNGYCEFRISQFKLRS